MFKGDVFMGKIILMVAISAALFNATTVFADSEIEVIKQQLDALKKDYEQRIQELEAKLLENEANTALEQKEASYPATSIKNTFNPDISLILDGRYASFDNDPENYELPGFFQGPESGIGSEGFSIGHTELIMSANIDENFYGKMTIALAEHDGELEVELEEAYIQTLGLGNGLTVKAGRFYSEMGYLNQQHTHYWDFADAPLIYRGIFGNQLVDDGLQMTYIAPTDIFLQLGAEISNGSHFPAGGSQSGVGTWTAFVDFGGDIGIEHSWQLGLSHWQANDISGREGGGHAHGGSATTETPSFSGDSKISALDLVYKWSPNGNPKQQNLKLQFEYFDRNENGTVTMLNSGPPEEITSYDGNQLGWYAQAVYQFTPQWRTGFRYDQLDSDNNGSDEDVLSEAGLDNEGHTPKRISAMLEWLLSEYSQIRLQYNHDQSYEVTDHQIFLQYTMSLGSHGAHQY